MTDLHLTQRELDIMGVLWELGEGTVTEVRDRVDPDLAYTSISSMIRTLELKGFVSHRRGEGKTHIYFPVIAPEAAGESAVVATKIDKLGRGERIRALRAFESVLETSVLPVSAVTGEGLDELWTLIDRLLSNNHPRSRPPLPKATAPPHPRKN